MVKSAGVAIILYGLMSLQALAADQVVTVELKLENIEAKEAVMVVRSLGHLREGLEVIDDHIIRVTGNAGTIALAKAPDRSTATPQCGLGRCAESHAG